MFRAGCVGDQRHHQRGKHIERHLPAARLPNPAPTTLGGVESAAAVAHQWIDSISTGGVPHLSQPAESDLSLTDITTNDVSIARHGLAPKAPNDANRFLDGTGAYSTPAGGAGHCNSLRWSARRRPLCVTTGRVPVCVRLSYRRRDEDGWSAGSAPAE